MAYRRKGMGQCDYALNPSACTTPPFIAPTTVIGGTDAITAIQTGPYVQPLGTSPADNTLAIAEAGLAANLPTYLMWGALAAGVVLVLGAVR